MSAPEKTNTQNARVPKVYSDQLSHYIVFVVGGKTTSQNKNITVFICCVVSYIKEIIGV